MPIKKILVDPKNDYKAFPDSQTMVDEYNETVEDILKITLQDQYDLNEIFIEAGLIEELSIH